MLDDGVIEVVWLGLLLLVMVGVLLDLVDICFDSCV